MRILLLYANPNMSVPVSPYGLNAIAGAVRARGVPAETLTVNPFIEHTEPEAYLAAVLDAFRPDLIGVSIRNIDNAIVALSGDDPPDGAPIDIVAYAPAVRRLVEVVKGWNPDTAIIAGGSGFTSCPEAFLRYLGLRYGVAGPGEDVFARLAEALAETGPPYRRRPDGILSGLPGTVVPDGAGYRMTPPAASLASAAFTPVTIAPEYQLLYQLRDIPVAVRTKSGCPLRCAYCTDPINLRRTDRRPSDHVVAEFRHHVEDHGFTRFHIADAELNLPYEDNLLRVCAGLRDSGLAERLTWRGYFNVKPFSDQLLDAIVAAGGTSPSFAVDSFRDEGLRAHRKNFRARHVHDVLDRLLARGRDVRPEVCLLLGHPGATLDGIDAEVDWMLRYADRGVQIAYSCGLRVYPNTPLARTPLDTAHVYGPSGGGRGGGTRLFTPQELLAEPVVYSAPLSPRDLARYVAERTGGHPNIGVFTDGPWPERWHAEELSLFNVGVHRLARGRYDAAADLLTRALRRNPGLSVARTALSVADPQRTATA